MAQIKNELGRDAVILHTRPLRKGGVFGFFSKKIIEITAAVESAPEPKPVIKKQPIIESRNPSETQITAVQLELGNMRKMLEQVLHKIPAAAEPRSPLCGLLEKNDIDHHVAEKLLNDLISEGHSYSPDSIKAEQVLLDRLGACLQRVEEIKVTPGTTKTVAFIGPTGVGKTTTIAKLAANFVIKEGRKVALITADTYRISAVEQLKTYADIIGVPLDIVYTPDELKGAMYRHQDKDLLFVDTAGRSPKNQYQLAELQALLETDPYIETHLVLSMTTKYKDALDIVRKFSCCSPQKFLFTKVDETSNIGTMLNLLYQFPVALSYVTTGQNVPDDIELADPGKLVSMILKE
ncbi:hypothetical protein P22_2193 [Propionispora sp. 2/2-37]|nr:hypothetical protein P22_2193 [Propionispora sp. 2/2-37]